MVWKGLGSANLCFPILIPRLKELFEVCVCFDNQNRMLDLTGMFSPFKTVRILLSQHGKLRLD